MANQQIHLSNHWGYFRSTGEIFNIVFERDLPHSVDTVWNALTQPDQLAQWLGKATVEPQVGGTVTIDFQGMAIVGQVLQWKDRELIEYTWTSDSFPGELSIVHWALKKKSDNRCHLQFMEKLVSPHYLTGAGPGWHYVLDTLALALDNKPIPVWNDHSWQEIAEQAKNKYKAILTDMPEAEKSTGGEDTPGAAAGMDQRPAADSDAAIVASANHATERKGDSTSPAETVSENSAKPAAKASLLIRKPAADVFEAFIDPAHTTQFWFSRSTGKLEAGKSVTWYWDDYGVSGDVTAQMLTSDSLIVWTWPAQGNINSTVTITLARRGENAVFVTAEETGWDAGTEGLHEILVGQTEGWALVLTGLKAYLEYGLRLNLVADHNPEALKEAP
ncbi:SRPBCC domain-containing protein [Paraflavitalea pollutisoli]|uniref:SRPBCC domain-containing protein n=1 Tax=Paraflavitalea pollutisoli TaxID=3034143 RepID=UPI0023EBC8B3|nr:SRPBCC domain-containing protein [Paraflavitalea sp. H1-2-19X]